MDDITTVETKQEDMNTSSSSTAEREEEVAIPGGIDSQEVDDLDMDIDFDEIEQDLERFQEDETVQQALQRGVDLKKYGRELEKDLKEVISHFVFFVFSLYLSLFFMPLSMFVYFVFIAFQTVF